MTKFTKSNWLPAKMADNLLVVGEQIRLARLRRNLSIEQVAERAQCSRLTVSRLEKGLPTVSVGVLLRVLYALQLGDDSLHAQLAVGEQRAGVPFLCVRGTLRNNRSES